MSDSKGLINVTYIQNPFDPKDFIRDTAIVDFAQPLSQLVPMGASSTVVSVNGFIVDEDKYQVTYLKEGDYIILCPVPHGGGGGGKSILRLVALIAIAVVAPQIAAAYASTAIGTFAITAGVTLAGNLLVNAILPPQFEKSKRTASKLDDSPGYGIDGPKNTSNEYVPVPVVYGKYRVAGNIINLFILNNDPKTQELAMMFALSEGPVAGFSNLLINDLSPDKYKNVEYEFHTGLDGETIEATRSERSSLSRYFDNTYVSVNVSQPIKVDDWIYSATQGEVDAIRLDFVAPAGLYALSKDNGDELGLKILMEAQASKRGQNDWFSISGSNVVSTNKRYHYTYENQSTFENPFSSRDAFESPLPVSDGDNPYVWGGRVPTATPQITETLLSGTFERDGVIYGQGRLITEVPIGFVELVPVYGDALVFESSSRTRINASFMSQELEEAEYDVRVRRLTPVNNSEGRGDLGESVVVDEIVLSDVTGVIREQVNYNHTARLELKIKLTDQLNRIPNVSVDVEGKVIAVYDPTQGKWVYEASSNPAWIVWDMLTNNRYGAGITPSRLDFDRFVAWATFCSNNNLQYNGSFDAELTLWDAVQTVCRTGHASMMNVGTKLTVVVDQPSLPVMMFSAANMVEGSFKKSWLPIAERANELEVTYYDAAEDYKPRIMRVYDPIQFQIDPTKQRVSNITLYGITTAEEAEREAKFQLAMNRFIRKTVEFSAPVEALGCAVGDVVFVQSLASEWSDAGKLASGSTATRLKLDRTVKIEANKQYRALVHFDFLALDTVAPGAYSIEGRVVKVNGFSGQPKVKVIRQGTVEAQIVEIYSGPLNSYYFVLDQDYPLESSQPIEILDTDAIEEVTVVGSTVGETDTLTLVTPMRGVPAAYSNFMFGEVKYTREKYRITKLSANQDLTVNVMGVEYDDRVYNFDGAVFLPNARFNTGASHVFDLNYYETTAVTQQGLVSQISLYWQTEADYAGAIVYISRDEQNSWQEIGRATNARKFVLNATPGIRLHARVVAFNLEGQSPPFNSAPTIEVVPTGEVEIVDADTVSGLAVEWKGRDCRIQWRYNSITSAVEFGTDGKLGADTGNLDPNFLDYQVTVYKTDEFGVRLKELRTEFTRSNSFTYTKAMNDEDGAGRYLEFEVRHRTTYSVSDASAILASNPQTVLTQADVDIKTTFGTFIVNVSPPKDDDFEGIQVYKALVIDGQQLNFQLEYDGRSTNVVIDTLPESQYKLRIGGYDAFGKDNIVFLDFDAFSTLISIEDIQKGVLDETLLDEFLLERINLVDASVNVVGSVNERIKSSFDNVQNTLDNLSANLDVRFNTVSSDVANVVTQIEGDISNAINTANESINLVFGEVNVLSNSLTTLEGEFSNATDNISARINAVSSNVANNFALISNEQTTRANADAALALDISRLTANVTNGLANLNAEIVRVDNVYANRTDALATSINSLTANVASDFGNVNASILEEKGVRANADAALSFSINALTASVNTQFSNVNASIVQTAQVAANATGAVANTLNALYAEFNTANSNIRGLITSESSLRVNADGVLASQINTLGGSINTVNTQVRALVLEETNLRVNADGVITTRLNTLYGEYNTANANIRGLIQTETNLRVNADGVITSRLDTLYGEYNTANANIRGLITDEANIRVNADGVLGTRINTLSASLNSATTNINASIVSLGNVVVTQNSALSTRIDGVFSSLNTVNTNISARITSIENAYVNADTAISGRIDTVAASINTVNSSIRAVIQNESNVRVNAEGALATAINTVSGGLANVQTRVSAEENISTGLKAQYTVKIDLNNAISGFGLASEAPVNGNPSSKFIINADAFLINSAKAVDETTNALGPFFVLTTSRVINGVTIPPGTYMKSAYIQDASITNAKITNLDAGKITTGLLSADRIDTRNLTIKDGSGNVIFAANTNLNYNRIAGGPPSDATRNYYFQQSATPSNAMTGDFWLDIGLNPNVLKVFIAGSGWQLASNYVTNTNQVVDGAALGQTANWPNVFGTGRPADFATVNRVFYQSFTPVGVEGDLWYDTSVIPYILRTLKNGFWVEVGRSTTNTNQLTDSARLGQTANWPEVSGTGRPADNATKNMVYYQSSVPPDGTPGNIWVNTGANPVTIAVISNGFWVPAGTVNFGSLANNNNISAANIGQLIQAGVISGTYIQDLAVSNAKIDTAAVTVLKIAGSTVFAARSFGGFMGMTTLVSTSWNYLAATLIQFSFEELNTGGVVPAAFVANGTIAPGDNIGANVIIELRNNGSRIAAQALSVFGNAVAFGFQGFANLGTYNYIEAYARAYPEGGGASSKLCSIEINGLGFGGRR